MLVHIFSNNMKNQTHSIQE